MEKQEEIVIKTDKKAVAKSHKHYNKCNMGGGISYGAT